MCLLFETVKVKNKRLCNIELHNQRVANSRRILFGEDRSFNLQDFITLPDHLDHGIYKCRIVYAKTVEHVEFERYTLQRICTLQIVEDDTIQYSHKYLDRSCIESLKRSGDADDILLVKNGFVSDVSFANIAFYNGKNWTTPSNPLLNGTKRQLLIKTGVIREEEIRCGDLDRFTHAALINAMLDLYDSPIIPRGNILPSH
jgi:4-amino-4-deoxychorismate lyase